MARIIHCTGSSRRASGFSLIEVMVAVVVLATGLLALAALQGALARNSADAKARSAVMSALTSRMNIVRQSPPADGITTFTCTAGNWVCTAQTTGSIGSLTVTQTVSTMVWKTVGGTPTFTAPAATDDLSKLPWFKRIGLSAQWTDASGADKTLALRSDVSAKMYGTGKGYPGGTPNGSETKRPVVRQDNPSNTPGVIPIASGDQATAASNPQPILEGRSANQLVGTRFDVLTYVPEGSTAKITKRFDTEVIKCRCQFGQGAKPNQPYGVAGKAQWPAVWTGDTYAVANETGDPAGLAAAAGEDPAYSGGGQGNQTRSQSEQCTECCRDRHDTATSSVKYDPLATTFTKYEKSGSDLVAVSNTSSGTYVESCRVVKSGGLWVTTADMYARQFGLLETSPVGLKQAKDGTPTNRAVTAYQSFVKNYLKRYSGSAADAPGFADGQSMFDNATDYPALSAPAKVTIAIADPTDDRYLHGRGLYVDYLQVKALKKIADAKAACPSGTPIEECILPYLPFTTINLTEMGGWDASDTRLGVNSGSLLAFNINQPFGGRTRGLAAANTDPLPATLVEIRKSNSGVAVSDDIPGATDRNGDEDMFTDRQPFEVLASVSTGADQFWVNVPDATSVTQMSYTIGVDGPAGCYGNRRTPTLYNCATRSILPAAGSITIKKYNRELTESKSMTASCTKPDGTSTSVTKTISVPAYYNYEISATSLGTIGAPVSDNTEAESTTISVTSIPKAGTITLTLRRQSSTPTYASIGTCSTNNAGTQLNVITWSKPWL